MQIYKITNLINQKKYFGQTTTSLKKRWYYHIWEVNKGKHKSRYLYKAIRKYGESNFKIETLCYVDTKEELNELEILIISEAILLYGKENVYNTTYGGEGGLSKTKGKTYEDLYGEERAKVLRKKRSDSLKDKPKSKEAVEASKASRLGMKHSEEARRHMSEAHKGNKNYFFGKELSEDHKQRISNNHADVSGINNPMFGKSVFDTWVDKYGIEEALFRENQRKERCNYTKILNGTNKHSEETKTKMRHPHNKRYKSN